MQRIEIEAGKPFAIRIISDEREYICDSCYITDIGQKRPGMASPISIQIDAALALVIPIQSSYGVRRYNGTTDFYGLW